MDYFEQGYELYRQEPDLMLIEVWRRVPPDWSRADQEAFLMGYIAMRRQRDQRNQEQDHESNPDQGPGQAKGSIDSN